MSEVAIAATQLVQELRVSAHLMTLHPGVFCIYHLAGSGLPDPANGLPGARLTLPPGPDALNVTISSFRDDGWLGCADTAALVRVLDHPAQILMTVYMLAGTPAAAAPKLQIMRLSDAVPAAAVDHAHPEEKTRRASKSIAAQSKPSKARAGSGKAR